MRSSSYLKALLVGLAGLKDTVAKYQLVRQSWHGRRHAERQASDKSWSVGGRRSPWPLACAPQGPCERRALALVAEALRALSGLGLCSLVS